MTGTSDSTHLRLPRTVRIVPASLVRRNYRKYATSAVTDFQEFPGRTHWIIAQEGWQEVAGFVLDWIQARILVDRRDPAALDGR